MQTTTRNATLADLREILVTSHARKLDVIAPATKFTARNGELVVAGTEPIMTSEGVTAADGVYLPTAVFDEGLASKLGIPPAYLKRLRVERPDLYDRNINGFLHGVKPLIRQPAFQGGEMEVVREGVDPDPRSFLMRLYRGDEEKQGVARAFLSDKYAMLDDIDALTAALSGVRDAGVDVQVKGCDLSDRRMYVRVTAPAVQAYAPELLKGYRSPFTGASGSDNPTVFAGFLISNSEVGNGAFSIAPQLTIQVCDNGMTITKDALRAVHLGGRQEEGVIKWSSDTNAKTLELITAKTRDAVATFLDVDYMKRVIASVEEKAGHKLTKADEVVRTVTKKLAFSQEAQDTVFEMFIQGGQTTAGGVMQAVTAAAQVIGDADEAADMEAAALRALDLATI